MTTPSPGGRTAAEPELCRVSVIGGNTQLDVGLPTAIPVASFIGDLVSLIESRNPSVTDGEDDAGPLQTQHWTLARLGRDPIPPSRTLVEAEVHDGDLLVLRAVGAKETPALFDDVIDAVSRLTADTFRGWSPQSARWTGLVAAVVSTVAAMALLAVGRSHINALVAGFVAAGVGVAAMVAAAIAVRRYSDTLAGTWLSLASLVLLFSGGAFFVPGSLGSPHLLLGFSVALVAAAVGYRATGIGATLFPMAITVALFGGIASAVRMFGDVALPGIGAGMLVGALIVISVVPRLSAVLARLPVPHVPTAGAAIDPADHEPRPTIEGIGAIGATALPSAMGLGRRAKAANAYQTGIMAGCTLAAVVGTVGAADPLGGVHWPGIGLAVVTSIILALRGRSFADLTQAGALIIGGAVIFVATAAGVALGDSRAVLISVGLLLVFAAAVVVFGVIGPHIEITPVMRRMNELFEYLLIVLVIPLVLWIMDVYSMARDI
ncbi:type VII secretion integral membrane protein EccD [Nocardia vaccinii]|uniref:type VII secretion integral membrane protein EccD n=1 Tax=Nocardia vaccinii TaxID=1822 RepID=UPI00083057DC|nr:type VII secretion integral membrane protein EccD [Nocardia vaccinii]